MRYLVIICFFFLIALFTPQAFAKAYLPNPDSIPFAPPVSYSVSGNPRGIFCADLDGDSDPDIVSANYLWDHHVSILKNNGDGTFQDAVLYEAGDWPFSIYCADLDGDLDLDIAVTSPESSKVSILINNGDATFQPPVSYGAGQYPISVFCADLDGDGDIDLAIANSNSGDVSILMNNGDGTFQSAVNYPAGYMPQSVFCADLDGDLDLDLAVASGLDSVSILKNNGDGTFASAINYQAGHGATSVLCADLDRDGDMDLAVTDVSIGNVSVLKNNGDGSFQPPISYPAGSGCYALFCSDLDGDNDIDIAVGNMIGQQYLDKVTILLNHGDGTFDPPFFCKSGQGPSASVFCADLDGDMDLDLAVAHCNTNNVSVFMNLVNSIPAPFSLVSPSDSQAVTSPVDFDWEDAIDTDSGDTVRYSLLVSESPNFHPDSTTIYDSLLQSHKTISLGPINTYYWKVKAYDTWGAVRLSDETWNFYVCLRGDANGDALIDIGDVIYLINFLFRTGSAPSPFLTGDSNCDGFVTVGDIVHLINYLFKSGPPPSC